MAPGRRAASVSRSPTRTTSTRSRAATSSFPARAASTRKPCIRSCARAAGAATGSTRPRQLRLKDETVIILDPVNRPVIDAALAAGRRDWIGGNCTVSLMLMAFGGLFRAGLVEWMTTMTYQAASGAGAREMRELLVQMGHLHRAGGALLDDPASAILDIDRRASAALANGMPVGAARLSARGEPAAVDRPRSRQRLQPRGVQGGRGGQQDPRPSSAPVPIDGICVRIGAMRCHSQARDDQAEARDAARRRRTRDRGRARVDPHGAERARGDARGASRLRRSPASSTSRSGASVTSRWARITSPRSRSATSCCGARPSRSGACCGCSSGADRRRMTFLESTGAPLSRLLEYPDFVRFLSARLLGLGRGADADGRRRLADLRDHAAIRSTSA